MPALLIFSAVVVFSVIHLVPFAKDIANSTVAQTMERVVSIEAEGAQRFGFFSPSTHYWIETFSAKLQTRDPNIGESIHEGQLYKFHYGEETKWILSVESVDDA